MKGTGNSLAFFVKVAFTIKAEYVPPNFIYFMLVISPFYTKNVLVHWCRHLKRNNGEERVIT
jgi:hypothetical protein